MEHVSVCGLWRGDTVSVCGMWTVEGGHCVCVWCVVHYTTYTNPLLLSLPPLPPFLASIKWCQHVCHADRLSTIHCGAIQHHHAPRQDAGEQDEPNP